MSGSGDRFEWAFSPGSSTEEEALFYVAEFEGYSQQAPAGLQPINETWQITCEVLTVQECDEIIQFLRYYAKLRQPFQIKDPDTDEWIWVDANRWTRDFVDVGGRSMKIELQRATRL